MTLREALVMAIDHIRETTHEGPLLLAAKVLERKAERLRARQETPAAWMERCHCGERKLTTQLACVECYRLIPMATLVMYHAPKASLSKRAKASIRAICETRIEKLEAAA